MMTRTVLISIVISAAAAAHPAEAQEQSDVARGARIWAATCNRCHNARSPLERSDADWSVIVSHMRTMANLTRSQANDITAFLQASNGGQNDAVGASQDDSTSSFGTFVHSRADSAASEKMSESIIKELKQLLRSEGAVNFARRSYPLRIEKSQRNGANIELPDAPVRPR